MTDTWGAPNGGWPSFDAEGRRETMSAPTTRPEGYAGECPLCEFSADGQPFPDAVALAIAEHCEAVHPDWRP